VTFLELPLVSHGLALGKRAASLIKRGAIYAQQIAALETRVTALEARFDKQPPDACASCGERGMRRIRVGHLWGESRDLHRADMWQCEKCGISEARVIRF
jgi:ribosomal protein L37AE/L43A